jgi:ABC-type transport system substrate-binding protein
MEVTRRELLKGAAALGVAGALSQALSGAAQAQTTKKKELVTAQAGDIAKFDPHFSTASQDIRVSFNLFDSLTSRHPDGKLHPGLATDWKLEGQTTWRFKLRQGSSFTTAILSRRRTPSSAWSAPTTQTPRRWSPQFSRRSSASRHQTRSRW